MAIPESQLITWSHQGAVTTAKATHESIRNALSKYGHWPEGTKYEFYLQGSYKNDTNIRGDSDVDVVVQLNSQFRRDISALSPIEQSLYKRTYSDAKYSWSDFRTDVIRALLSYYGSGIIREGRKSLKVAAGQGRLPADVVVCIQYRKYLRFLNMNDQNYVEGMTFYVTSETRWIINYPKQHYRNGIKKNAQYSTDGWYKPTVRVFKNIRSYLVDDHVITNNLVPSYFLECLLYNVLNGKFGRSYQDTFCNVVNWLNQASLDQFICQNEQLILFGNSPEQWSTANAKKFIQEIINLWNNY